MRGKKARAVRRANSRLARLRVNRAPEDEVERARAEVRRLSRKGEPLRTGR